MAWRRPGDKPLFEPMLAILPTQICVTRPQLVKVLLSLLSETMLAYESSIPWFQIMVAFEL